VDREESLPECVFGDASAQLTLVLWGDSHAAQWLPVLDPVLKQRGIKGLQRVHGGCPPGLSREHLALAHFQRCYRFTELVLEDLAERTRYGPVAVILAARWAAYANERRLSFVDQISTPAGWSPGAAPVERSLNDAIDELARLKLAIGIVQAVPELQYSAPICLYRRSREACGVAWEIEEPYLRPAIAMVGRVAAARSLPTLDVPSLLCQDGTCPAAVDDTVLYWDDDHLSASGAHYLRPALERFIQHLAKSPD
jgi:hypothetical protein